MPDAAGNDSDAHQKHHGSRSEQESQKPHQQAHYRSALYPFKPWRQNKRRNPSNSRPAGVPPGRHITLLSHTFIAAEFSEIPRSLQDFYKAAAMAKLGPRVLLSVGRIGGCQTFGQKYVDRLGH